MFEKSLSDLIRGIRANKRSEQTYITTCLDEIRAELKAKDSHVKYLAVAKLCYLHMLGYDGAWAAFPILEVMAAPKFAYKRCGYLAASLSFRQDTEILMLCTNLLRKDLTSHHVPEIGVALDGLAHIATPELARDLSQDTLQLLHHPQVYVVKRAVLTLYKLFLKYPEALRASFPVLKERLEHPDPAVVSAVVNVICELARQNPRNYLPLAPHFYRLLNDSGNNWMLIKIVKLFASLTPLEPRLARKLVAPLTALVQKTPAMSVLYECIHTAIVGGIIDVPTPAALRAPNEPDDPDAPPQLAVLCAAKLRLFLKDNDHNLKYIGLLAMTELQARYPELVLEHRTLILRCLDDADLNIRLRALDLVAGVVDQENLIDVVRRLLGQLTAGSGHHLASQDVTDGAKSHRLDGSAGLTAEAHVTVAGVLTSGPSAYIESPEYRRAVVDRILTMCSARLFAHVADFEWYLAVLVDLVYVAGVNAGSALTAQFMAVAVRVSSVRPLAVKMMTRLLADRTLLESAAQPASNAGVLYAAAWIAGEYCDHHTSPLTLLQYLLDPAVARLPDPAVQAVYLQSIAKVLVSVVRAAHTRLTAGASCPDLTQPRWQPLFETLATTDAATQAGFAGSPYPEVRARAHDVRAMVAFFRNLRNGAWATTHLNDTTPSAEALNQVNGLLHGAFAARALNPVAARAQAKVPLPANLDLDVWFNPVVGRELEGLRGLDGAVAALRIFPVPSQSEARDGHRQRHHRGPTSSRRTRETEVPLPPLCTPEGFPILVPEEPKPTPRASDTRSRPRSKYLGSHRSKNPFYISEAKSGRADFYSLDEGSASDVDQIPIVQLDLNDISPSIRSMSASNAEKRPRRHRQSSRAHHNHDGVDHRSGKPSADGEDEDKKARRHRRPAPAPAIMIPEEMPDGVEASDSETGPHQSTGRTAATRDALTLSELDTQRLTTLDLTVPGATNVALPKSQAYAHPETTRRVEQAKFWKQARQTTSVTPADCTKMTEPPASPDSSTKPRLKERRSRKHRSSDRSRRHRKEGPTEEEPLPVKKAATAASSSPPVSNEPADGKPKLANADSGFLAETQAILTNVLCATDELVITYQPQLLIDYTQGDGGFDESSHSSAARQKVMVAIEICPRDTVACHLDYVEFSFAKDTARPPRFTQPAPVTVASANPMTGKVSVPDNDLRRDLITSQWELEVHGTAGAAELHGQVTYHYNGHEHEADWRLTLWPQLFLNSIARPVSSDAFTSIVSNPADFPYTGTGIFQVACPYADLLAPLLTDFPLPRGYGRTVATAVLNDHPPSRFGLFLDVVVRNIMGLQIVECIGTAASLYGRTVHGVQVAALVKAQPLPATNHDGDDDGPPSSRVTIEVKCSDKPFLSGLLDALHLALPTHPNRV